MKVQEVILKAMAGSLKWWEAAEIIGVFDRTMRRWRERYQEGGYDGLYCGAALGCQRVLKSYRRIEMAACVSSVRTSRPNNTNSIRSPLSRAGQLTTSSIDAPAGRADLVVNSTPLPLILRVLPDPTGPGLSSPSTLYRTFRMTGRRSDVRRSSVASVRPGILFDIATAARENSYTARNGPVFFATKDTCGWSRGLLAKKGGEINST